MRYQNIGFIGCGNMGGALAKCAAKGVRRLGDGQIWLSNFSEKKAAALAECTGGAPASNAALAECCDLLFLGVKPQMLKGVLSEISPILAARTDRFVLVSMVAGVPIARITELLGGAYPLIRIMPNTAAAVGAGMVQFCSEGVTDAETDAFVSLMADAGLFDELPEHLIDAASAVSGCGTAYLCLVLEGMADGGVALGLSREKALRYAAKTIEGLGRLYLETGAHPGVIKDGVTSPGGTTIQGVRALENRAVRAAFTEAVLAAFARTEALKKST